MTSNGEIISTEQLLSDSVDYTITMWDTQTKKKIRVFKGHHQMITSLSCHPTNSTFASGSNDCFIGLWEIEEDLIATRHDYETQEAEAEQKISPISQLSWSPDGIYLASSHWNKTIQIHSIPSSIQMLGNIDMVTQMMGHSKIVNTVSWSPHGNFILSGSSDHTVKVWSSKTYELILSVEGHTGEVSSLTWMENETYFVSASSDTTIRLWSLRVDSDSRLAYHCDLILRRQSQIPSSVVWTPILSNTRIIASGFDDGSICLWSAHSGELLLRFPIVHSSQVSSLAWNRNKQHLISSSWDRSICIWLIKPSISLFECTLLIQLTGHSNIINSISIASDGKFIASGSNDSTICIWKMSDDLSNSPKICSLSVILQTNSIVMSVAWGPEYILASAGSDQTIRIWDSVSSRN